MLGLVASHRLEDSTILPPRSFRVRQDRALGFAVDSATRDAEFGLCCAKLWSAHDKSSEWPVPQDRVCATGGVGVKVNPFLQREAQDRATWI